MVTLVNGGTASASEILAGALQDDGRSPLLGERTFGKGLIQTLIGLGNGSGLAVTVARYATPSGRDIHKYGIDPDVTAKMTELEAQRLKLEDLGTRKDSQYRVAETTLVKRLRAANGVEKAYNPASANLPSVLAKPAASQPSSVQP
jgi:carboxyl-terminal processing protease